MATIDLTVTVATNIFGDRGFVRESIGGVTPEQISGHAIDAILSTADSFIFSLFVESGEEISQDWLTSVTVATDNGPVTLLAADAYYEGGFFPMWTWEQEDYLWPAPGEGTPPTRVVTVVTAEPTPPPSPATCEEIGRATRAYVSAYDRARVHQSRVYRFEKRCLVANFNGAIPPGRTIVSATWRTDSPEIGVMSDPSISANGRETAVMFAAQLGGWTNICAEVTLDNGEIYNQVFRVNVREASWFFNDPPSQSGPFSVTVTAEEE